jgi:hypothetical protein
MPLVQASSAVYLALSAEETDLKKMEMLGALGPQGVYRMALPPAARPAWHFVLYDFVKQQIWHRIDVEK